MNLPQLLTLIISVASILISTGLVIFGACGPIKNKKL